MRRSIAVAAALIGLAGAARAETSNFHIVANSVSIDSAAQSATFTLEFDRAPDFSVDAFQYEIDADTSSLEHSIDFMDIDTVIRGGEISTRHGIPVRDRDGEGGPSSGGWGPIRALLPYEIDGTVLTFSAGLSAVGDTDGRFRYRLFAAHDGALTGQTNGNVIPLPTALWTGALMLGGIGVVRFLRKGADN